MIVDFAAQTAPVLWALAAALVILTLLIVASIDPELTEVYFGDMHIFVATIALAALGIILLVPERAELLHQLGLMVSGR